MNEVVQQLREVQNELFDLSERFRAAEDVLRRTAIVAIQDGTIVGLQVHTPGGVIAPGEPLMDIVPSGERLVIEARVDPNDIDVVEAGLPARVQLTAFNPRTWPPSRDGSFGSRPTGSSTSAPGRRTTWPGLSWSKIRPRSWTARRSTPGCRPMS